MFHSGSGSPASMQLCAFSGSAPCPAGHAHTRGHMVLSQPAHRIYRTILIAAIMGFLFAFIDFYAQRCFLFGTGEYAPFYHSLSVFFYCLITALVVNGMSPKIVRSKKSGERQGSSTARSSASPSLTPRMAMKIQISCLMKPEVLAKVRLKGMTAPCPYT